MLDWIGLDNMGGRAAPMVHAHGISLREQPELETARLGAALKRAFWRSGEARVGREAGGKKKNPSLPGWLQTSVYAYKVPRFSPLSTRNTQTKFAKMA